MKHAIAAAWLCLAPEPLSAEAQEAVRRAQTYVADGNYEAARAAVAEAAAMQEHPAILFVRGQVERYAGDCAAAIEYYQAFADLQSNPDDASEANRLIEECKEQLPETEARGVIAPEPGVDGPVEDPPAVVREPDSPPPDSGLQDTPTEHWRRDALGGALVGVGAVVLGSGIGTLAAGLALRPEPVQTPTEGDYAQAVTRARRLQTAGTVLVPLGAVTAIGGVIRYAVVARRGRRSRRVSASLGSVVSVAVRF